MLRKLVAGSLLAGALFAAPAATAGIDDPFDPCFLHAGCFWSTADMRWYCSDPGVYAMCAP